MTDAPDVQELITKERFALEDLQRIIAILRAPGGCPWDAKQTHASIKKNFIEETYEAIEAINKEDDILLCEELGDVLLQIALHVEMAQERGAFGWEQVIGGISRKLIERHPHVFGEMQADDAEQALSNWDAVKRKSKGQTSTGQAMDSVPRELPALMRATALQKKAAKLEQLPGRSAACSDVNDAMGELLFSAVQLARLLPECDAEEALTAASDAFLKKVKSMES